MKTNAEATVDVRDMIVVHTALLREFRLAPSAVELAGRGSTTRVRDVAQHIELICALLHHHHAGEDALLWPVLSPRLSPRERALVAVAQSQHAAIEKALERVEVSRAAWTERTSGSTGEDLIVALQALYAALHEHLDAEERDLLPLAAVHLDPSEWQSIGEAGAAAIAAKDRLLVFGMFAYESDPAVLATMLQRAPAPVRLLVPRLAPRMYARHAARMLGTRRP